VEHPRDVGRWNGNDKGFTVASRREQVVVLPKLVKTVFKVCRIIGFWEFDLAH
jgi:hypothetical protein